MTKNSVVHVVEDDDAMRESLVTALEDAGYEVRAYQRAEEFLAAGCAGTSECVVSDVQMPGVDGLSLLRRLQTDYGLDIPLILISGHGDIPLAVAAMKAGAIDFLEKPFEVETLLKAVAAALRAQSIADDRMKDSASARRTLEKLTPRELDVFTGLVAGYSNKEIAARLALSPRTVEFHRAHIMEKTVARSLPELVRLWISAGQSDNAPSSPT